jgi:hypothetical protein
MRHILIRYRTKPDKALENADRISAVFRELGEKAPDDLRYIALQLADGTFLHLVLAEGDTGALTSLDAFQSFQAGIAERCLEMPKLEEVTVVGSYRMAGHAAAPHSKIQGTA